MNKYLLVLPVLAILSLVSCAEPPAGDEEVTAPPTVTSAPVMAAPSDTVNSITTITPSTTASTNNPLQVTTAKPNNALPVAKPTGALNPEHGKPGHRCDIPVGTALSTPVQPMTQPTVQPNQQSPTPQPSIQTVQPQPVQSAPATKGKGRLNPPHGEAGHDCAVAVGQPLN